MQRSRARSLAVRSAVALLWGSAVIWGFYLLTQYQYAPGAAARTSDSWPAAAPIKPDERRPTLLVFAHPHCPCTSATIEELDRLLSGCNGLADTRVFFYADPGLGEDWAKSALWKRTARIPGLVVEEDPFGTLARVFGARTSGQALLYGPDGRLLFRGGVTASRGHEGDNLGRSAIEALLRGEAAPDRAPVFGCSLFDEEPAR